MPPFFPTRARGQNFLHDRRVAERFAAAALDTGDGGPADTIVEIGPGKGALTLPLLAAGARVLAIELDDRLVPVLKERAQKAGSDERLTVVVGDALEIDLAAAIEEFGAKPPLPICGNLPFSTASPLLLRLIEREAGPPLFDTLTLTLQREVANRVVAPCGGSDYSALSVVAQQAAHTETLFLIHPGAFRPRPRVVSAVVRLIPRHDPPDIGTKTGAERHFRRLVRGLFAHRRKTLRKAIRYLSEPNLREAVEAAVEQLGLDPGLRPGELTVEDYAALSRLTHR